YTSSNYTSTTFVNPLALLNPAPYTFASSLYGNAGFRSSAIAGGLTPNFFQVNPGKLGGANLLTNFGGSHYNAGTLEVRRRFASGLLFNANYTFAKAIQDLFLTWRKPLDDQTQAVSPLNITHAFKVNWIYELPVGRGRALLGSANGVVDRILGGWAID